MQNRRDTKQKQGEAIAVFISVWAGTDVHADASNELSHPCCSKLQKEAIPIHDQDDERP